MGIEPTRKALPSLSNKGFGAMANAKCVSFVLLPGACQEFVQRRDDQLAVIT
jgi:hypothetical protein